MHVSSQLIVYVMLALFVLGCGDKSDEPHEESEIVVNPSSVQKIDLIEIDELYPAVGTVRARTTARIAAKVMGTVAEVRVREGDTVEQGDLLVVLSSKELESRVEAARNAIDNAERILAEAEADRQEADAQLDLARITYERFQELRQRESVSLQEFDEVRAKFAVAQAKARRADEAIGSLQAKKKQAEAALEEAETFYRYTKIRAQFAGIITQKYVDEGDLAQPGSLLLVLEDRTVYQLEVSVDESHIAKIRAGEEIAVSLDALVAGLRFSGTVAEVVPRIDPLTRTFMVKISLPTIQGITSGMYGKAFFPVGKTQALLVPLTALAECGQLSTLYVVNADNRVERRLVKTGKRYGERIEILSGLDAGEPVVVRGVQKLIEGCLVRKRP